MKNEQIERAESLSDLKDLVAACRRCPLYKTKTMDVPGNGNPKAKIMFIGEAPGKQEDLTGEPFIGAAGKFLNEMLSSIGLKREDVFIGNVVKHRPPGNRDPEPSEIQACWPYLARQIEIIRPKLIVFLGRHSLNRFFPAAKITDVHGQAFRRQWQGRDQAFLALYHPAAALYKGSMREILSEDFQKIPKLLSEIESEKSLIQDKLI